ncbi:MAG: hypothetical protein EBZ61_01115 [Micrococcales bacterium]|nr:hypothetical protein [Micrococcales bacterium]
MKKPLSETHPELAAEWHPTLNGDLTPDKVSAGSNVKIWWLGNCGHKWEATVKSRSQGRGCGFCSGNKVLVGLTDLRTTHPEITKEWHPTLNGDKTPDRFSAGSGKSVWWLGSCGHEWEATISNRTFAKSKCPVCFGTETLTGFNDLATTHPELAAEWHPTLNENKEPNHFRAGSGEKAWWLGNCGHTWEAIISSRSLVSRNCPYCAGRLLLAGFNDLATTHPELAAEWHPTLNGKLTPQLVSGGKNDIVWWLGSCGHKWRAGIKSRVQGRGCGYCSGNRVLAGFNDLATTHPELAAEWDFSKNTINPEEVSFGSGEQVWWVGACRHSWRALIAARASGTGCPKCAKGGFSSVDPGTLYFLHNPALQSFKVGITNRDKKFDRIQMFSKKGWQLVKCWQSDSGLIILNCETIFFKWLRQDRRIPIYLEKSNIGSMRGETETFSDSILSQAEVISKIESILKSFEESE